MMQSTNETTNEIISDALVIERMSYGPEGISHTSDGKTVFVAGGVVPGDIVHAKRMVDKKSYAKAQCNSIQVPSKYRIDARCKLGCGACPWQCIQYDKQLQEKQDNILAQMKRIGGLSEAVLQSILPIAPSPKQWNYRNKLELNVRFGKNGYDVGMLEAYSSNLSQPNNCPSFDFDNQAIIKAIRGALRKSLGNTNYGVFRIGVRHSSITGDTEVAVWTTPGNFPRNLIRKIFPAAFESFGGLTSLVHVIAKPGKRREIKNVEVLIGKGFWEEKITILDKQITFQTSAPSFFQVNTQQAMNLITEVVSFFQVEGSTLAGKHIVDLYSGGGTFSIPLAKCDAKVSAVESASSSVKDLRRNARNNQIEINVIGGDAAIELPKLSNIDGLVVDPPRAGLGQTVVCDIAKSSASRVAYVSCDPATLARDLKQFIECGFKINHIQPFDMFPQTFHVENVAFLVRS